MIWIVILYPIAFLGMFFVLYHAIYKSIMKNATKEMK